MPGGVESEGAVLAAPPGTVEYGSNDGGCKVAPPVPGTEKPGAVELGGATGEIEPVVPGVRNGGAVPGWKTVVVSLAAGNCVRNCPTAGVVVNITTASEKARDSRAKFRTLRLKF